MKKEKVIDERVRSQQNKIKSEAFGILMIILFISIFIQQTILDAPFKQYFVEVICFLGVSFYIIVRYISLGVDIYGESKKSKNMLIINSIVTGVIVTGINGVFNYMRYKDHYRDNIKMFIGVLLITFISATVSTIIVLAFVKYLNDKRQESIEKKFDDEE